MKLVTYVNFSPKSKTPIYKDMIVHTTADAEKLILRWNQMSSEYRYNFVKAKDINPKKSILDDGLIDPNTKVWYYQIDTYFGKRNIDDIIEKASFIELEILRCNILNENVSYNSFIKYITTPGNAYQKTAINGFILHPQTQEELSMLVLLKNLARNKIMQQKGFVKMTQNGPEWTFDSGTLVDAVLRRLSFEGDGKDRWQPFFGKELNSPEEYTGSFAQIINKLYPELITQK
jgi:hypothetical protein